MKNAVKDFFSEQQARDKKSLDLVYQNRLRLISEGNYPKRFSMPLGLQLELTSRCNLFCEHCYNRSGRAVHPDRMGINDWVHVCEDIVRNGGIFQATISGGEPLILGEHLFKILAILATDGTVFNLITNGFLFDKEVINRLSEYNFFWIQVSIDSSDEALHDQFRGLNGSWKKAVQAATYVANSGFPLRIATTITPKTLFDVDAVCKMAFDLGATYFVLGDVIPSGRAFDHPSIFLNNEQRRELFDRIQFNSKKYENRMVILGGGSVRTQLEYASQPPIDGAIIRPNGNIRLDCSSPFVIGNVLEETLSNIWKRMPADCWSKDVVKAYIESVDYLTGESSVIRNYCNEDVAIF